MKPLSDMTLPELKNLMYDASPGPVYFKEDTWGDKIIGNADGHAMTWGDQLRLVFEAGNEKADGMLYSLALELLEEVIRHREEMAD